MNYLLFKHIHVTCVVISGLGFSLRGWWMWRESDWLGRRIVRTAPHIVDTVLLGSAISMAILSGQYPFAQHWLTAKLCGLIAYVACGSVALRRGHTKAIQVRFLCLALLAYAYIVCVALTRQVLPFT